MGLGRRGRDGWEEEGVRGRVEATPKRFLIINVDNTGTVLRVRLAACAPFRAVGGVAVAHKCHGFGRLRGCGAC